jgi:hypothetical protein
MTQDEPAMDGSTEAGHDEKVAGIVEQVRADMQLRPMEDSQRLLRERLANAGLELGDEEITRIAQDVQNGPSAV